MRPKQYIALFVLLLGAAANSSFAQPASVLAIANGFTFTANDLSPEGRQLFDQQAKLIADHRKALFDQWIFEELLEMEAKVRGTTREKIEAEAIAKAAVPSEVQVKAVYDGNRQSIGNRTLDEVRPNIVAFLNREAQTKQLASLFDSLKTKYRFTSLKGVGPPMKAVEVVASIGTRQITVGEFEFANRIALYNFRAGISEDISGDLENAIYAKLLEAEAKKRNVDASTVVATEITNKLKDFTDSERMNLEEAFQAKLFRDYSVKFLLPALEPQKLNVSADDDPTIGPATAKVTVVAFVDFQCSACAAFSPLMKQVINEFPGSVRLVVRDYPITQIHEHGMDAALAGYAARQQGKFFEMTDLMYRNQDTLDTASLIKFARELGMNAEQFERDMSSPAAAAEVKKDIADAESFGVGGTPTLFVNGVRLQRLSAARLRNLIQSALK
jgi:protein-disulfide isomerase